MPKANQFDRRSGLSVVELLVVCTILGLLCALILPGVENARELMRHPKPLPSWEQRVARLGLWGFLVIPLATAGGALLFGICVRLLLPPAYRKHLPWVTPPRTQPPPATPAIHRRNVLLAIASAFAPILMIVCLVVAENYARDYKLATIARMAQSLKGSAKVEPVKPGYQLVISFNNQSSVTDETLPQVVPIVQCADGQGCWREIGLSFENVPVTDEGLRHLETLTTEVDWISLSGTNVSEKEIERWQERRLRCPLLRWKPK